MVAGKANLMRSFQQSAILSTGAKTDLLRILVVLFLLNALGASLLGLGLFIDRTPFSPDDDSSLPTAEYALTGRLHYYPSTWMTKALFGKVGGLGTSNAQGGVHPWGLANLFRVLVL
jgi:hypothetical protein